MSNLSRGVVMLKNNIRLVEPITFDTIKKPLPMPGKEKNILTINIVSAIPKGALNLRIIILKGILMLRRLAITKKITANPAYGARADITVKIDAITKIIFILAST